MACCPKLPLFTLLAPCITAASKNLSIKHAELLSDLTDSKTMNRAVWYTHNRKTSKTARDPAKLITSFMTRVSSSIEGHMN